MSRRDPAAPDLSVVGERSLSSLAEGPYVGEEDLERVVELGESCEATDRVGAVLSISELRSLFETPTLDRERLDRGRHARLWRRPDGALAGYGHLLVPESGIPL